MVSTNRWVDACTVSPKHNGNRLRRGCVVPGAQWEPPPAARSLH
ncbi:hypothetical protein I552_3157 [Mycobacterium xenopi 3993]|nr:hypothetical protein I552_3157 [Mycobacterium xenopi 3993]